MIKWCLSKKISFINWRWHLTCFSYCFLFDQSYSILIFSLFGFKFKLFFPKIFFLILDIYLSLFVITLNFFLSGLVLLDKLKLFSRKLFCLLLYLFFLSLKRLHDLFLSWFELLDSFFMIFWNLIQSKLVLRLKFTLHLCPDYSLRV